MKILGIVQARRGSANLPGKVLRDLNGEPMLVTVLQRAARAASLDRVVVALPDNRQDDPIEQLCHAYGFYCFRGSEADVLDRIYRTAIGFCADVVVPLRGNCPLVDPELIDGAVTTLISHPEADWSSNSFPKATYPRGLEVEAIHIAALKRAWQEDTHAGSRERVDAYFARRVDLFQVAEMRSEEDYSYLDYTVNTLQDLERLRSVFENFGHNHFGWRDAVAEEEIKR